jgi:hypothetical protein
LPKIKEDDREIMGVINETLEVLLYKMGEPKEKVKGDYTYDSVYVAHSTGAIPLFALASFMFPDKRLRLLHALDKAG